MVINGYLEQVNMYVCNKYTVGDYPASAFQNLIPFPAHPEEKRVVL
jgi:hypothetical protein